MTEMTAISADGRMTPACPGLWSDEQAHAFASITRFVHENSGRTDRCAGQSVMPVVADPSSQADNRSSETIGR